jgi:hypothetical protein
LLLVAKDTSAEISKENRRRGGEEEAAGTVHLASFGEEGGYNRGALNCGGVRQQVEPRI